MAKELLDSDGNTQIRSSSTRIELKLDVLTTEQREIYRLVKSLESQFSVCPDISSRLPTGIASRQTSTSAQVVPEATEEHGGISWLFETGEELNRSTANFERLAIQASEKGGTNLDKRWPFNVHRRPELDILNPRRRGASARAEGSFRQSSSNMSLSSTASLVTTSRSMSSTASLVTTSRSKRPALWMSDGIEVKRNNIGIILPASLLRSLIDVVGMLLLAWDLTFTPLQLAWDLRIEGWLLVMAFCVASYWTLDVFFSLRTAFYTTLGDLETRPSKIAVHYLRHQFCVDLIILLCDWVNIFAGIFPNGLNLLRTLKATRLVRLVRVARLFSQDAVNRLHILGLGLTFVESVKIICFCCWLTHVISCAWFGIGKSSVSDTNMYWIDSSWAESAPSFAEANMGYQYTSSLQWTLSTMVSGTSSVVPLNSLEQIFSCFCILLGLLGQAFVISILSSAAVEEKSRHRHLSTVLSSMEKFCSTHRVNAHLTMSARRQVKASMVSKAHLGLSTTQVEGLQIASTKIRMGILQEVFEPHLNHHAIFLLSALLDGHTISKVTNDAMDVVYVQIGHDIFMAGNAATRIFLLSRGQATYMQDPATSKEEEHRAVDVLVDTWFCEPALWCKWTHVGTMEVSSAESEVYCLGALDFLRIVSTSETLKQMMYEYAVLYHRRIKESVPPFAPWPNDVQILGASFAHILVSMPETLRKRVNSKTLDCSMNLDLIHISSDRLNTLYEELNEGKANLMLCVMSSSLLLQRIVSVARIHLVADDDLVFIELWRKRSDGSKVVTCEIPNTEQRESEDIFSTISRLVDRLRPAAHGITLVSTNVTEDLQQSRSELPVYQIFINAHYEAIPSFANSQPHESPLPKRPASIRISQGTNGVMPLQRTHTFASNKSRSFLTKSTTRFWRMPSNSQYTNEAIESELKRRLSLEKKVHTFHIDENSTPTAVYAWLSRAEVDYLQTARGMEFLEALVQDAHWRAAGQNGDASPSSITCSNSCASPPSSPRREGAGPHEGYDEELRSI